MVYLAYVDTDGHPFQATHDGAAALSPLCMQVFVCAHRVSGRARLRIRSGWTTRKRINTFAAGRRT